MEVQLLRGLPERHRGTAALIFEDAFGREQRLAVPDPDKRVSFFERVIDARHVVAAVAADELVGLMGLSSRAEAYRGGVMAVSWDPRQLHDLLGWLGATWAQWSTRVGAHRPEADELYVEGLVVAPDRRGSGIGTRLLGEAELVATELGLRWLRLDVIDTNPRARALYARLGFRVTKTEPFGILERWAGYGALISMERRVGDEPKLASAPDD